MSIEEEEETEGPPDTGGADAPNLILRRLWCTDVRDTCVVGNALRRGRDPAPAVAAALEALLYQGVGLSVKPVTRAEAAAALVRLQCDAHGPIAESILASLSPRRGLPRERLDRQG